jgi:hypothetical protein
MKWIVWNKSAPPLDGLYLVKCEVGRWGLDWIDLSKIKNGEWLDSYHAPTPYLTNNCITHYTPLEIEEA